MAKFGSRSKARLATCDEDLQELFEEVVKIFDCTVLCGHRGEKDQNEAYEKGNSKVKYPHGRHNAKPSNAVDVTPYPVDYENTDRHYYFGGYVLATAEKLGLKVRWGGDWDGDRETKDQTFNDLVHFEVQPQE